MNMYSLPDPQVRRWQVRVEPFFKLAFAGCHMTRHIPSLLTTCGFTIEQLNEGVPCSISQIRYVSLLGSGAPSTSRLNRGHGVHSSAPLLRAWCPSSFEIRTNGLNRLKALN